MRTDLDTGDAFVYSKDPGKIVIWIRHEPKYTVVVHPEEGISWQEYIDKVATPALAAEGWHLNAWHRPRQNDQVIATAVVWR